MKSECLEEYVDPDAFYVKHKYNKKEHRSIYYKNSQRLQIRQKINEKSLPQPILVVVENSEYLNWQMADYLFIIGLPHRMGKWICIIRFISKVVLKGMCLELVLMVVLMPKSTLILIKREGRQ